MKNPIALSLFAVGAWLAAAGPVSAGISAPAPLLAAGPAGLGVLALAGAGYVTLRIVRGRKR